jgi:hypothetical protein
MYSAMPQPNQTIADCKKGPPEVNLLKGNMKYRSTCNIISKLKDMTTIISSFQKHPRTNRISEHGSLNEISTMPRKKISSTHQNYTPLPPHHNTIHMYLIHTHHHKHTHLFT